MSKGYSYGSMFSINSSALRISFLSNFDFYYFATMARIQPCAFGLPFSRVEVRLGLIFLIPVLGLLKQSFLPGPETRLATKPEFCHGL